MVDWWFNDGRWEELIRESQAIADEANSHVAEEETTPAMRVNRGQPGRTVWSKWESSPEGEPCWHQERMKLLRR